MTHDTIHISEKAYETLNEKRHEDETISDVIERMLNISPERTERSDREEELRTRIRTLELKPIPSENSEELNLLDYIGFVDKD